MNGRIRRCTPYLYKRFSTPAAAETAATRSTLLHKTGVQTPCAKVKEGSRLVRFDLIDASPGFDVLLRQGNSVLTAMMQSLAALHATKHLPNLLPYQPMQKIAPRLSQAGHQALAPTIKQALDEIDGLPTEACVVHGDLHANQFLVDLDRTCWVIDFDDLAIGDPAADLGNFAAHLATRHETASGAPLTAMRRWLAIVLDVYCQAGGSASTQSADVYGRVALVRRALKLQEKRPGAFAEKLLMGLYEAS